MDWNAWGDAPFWIAFGLLAQGLFTCRFLVQWIASERAGRSYVPLSFWYLSMAGSITLAIYAVHRQEPLFLLGQLPGCAIYARNLVLVYRRGPPRESPAAGPGGEILSPEASQLEAVRVRVAPPG